MIKTKIEFNKTKGKEWFDAVTKFISDTLAIPFVPVWDELTLYVDTCIIGWFKKDNHNVITFKYNKGAEWITNKPDVKLRKVIAENLTKDWIVDVQEEINIGDWVETCAMLPGIVTSVDYDGNHVPYDITAFQPEYNDASSVMGGSHSVVNCGVHRISGEYAHMLLAIGKEKLEELYSDAKKKYMAEHPDTKYVEFDWKKIVTEYYNKHFVKYKTLY